MASASTAVVVAAVALAGADSHMFRSTGHNSSPGRGTSPSVVAPAATGVPVSGAMWLTGGPSATTGHGTPGTVTFLAGDGTETTVGAASDGAFSLHLKPGEYSVTGTSFLYGDGHYLCHARNPITVSTNSLIWVLVACERR